MVSDASGSSILLSYDVSGDNRTAAARVSHLVFGRRDAGTDAAPPYIGRPGVVWLGQSVLLLPAPLAHELALKLEALGAHVATAHITVQTAELEAFRRRMRRHMGP